MQSLFPYEETGQESTRSPETLGAVLASDPRMASKIPNFRTADVRRVPSSRLNLSDSIPGPRGKQPGQEYDRYEWAQVPNPLKEAAARSLKSEAWPIYIYGGTGSGKSGLLVSLFRRWRGSADFWLADQLISDIVASRTGAIEKRVQGQVVLRSEEWYWSRLESVGLLCLDDFGLRSRGEAGQEVVFRIVNMRVGKPTIIASNLPLTGDQSITSVYDSRVASRLGAGCVIYASGPDLRLGHKRKFRA